MASFPEDDKAFPPPPPPPDAALKTTASNSSGATKNKWTAALNYAAASSSSSTSGGVRSEVPSTTSSPIRPILISDLGNTTGDRAMDSLIQNLENSEEKEVSETILKGLPEKMVSVMLDYKNGSGEHDHPSSIMEEGQARLCGSSNRDVKLAAAADTHSLPKDNSVTDTFATLTTPNLSSPLPKPRRVRNITGVSLGSKGSNKATDSSAVGKPSDAPKNKNVQALPLENKRKISTGYNLAQLANCLMEEQRGGLRHKLEINRASGEVRDETSLFDAGTSRRPVLNKERTVGEPTGETNSSLLFKNAALLFLKENKRSEATETLEVTAQEKSQDNDIHHRAAVQRWNNLRAALAVAQGGDKSNGIAQADERSGTEILISPSSREDEAHAKSFDNDDDDNFDPESNFDFKVDRRSPMQRRWLLFKYRISRIFQVRKDLKNLAFSLQVLGGLGAVLLGTASILFYCLGNPMTLSEDGSGASFSWWFILTFRWICTLCLAKAIEYFYVDIVALRSNFSLKLFGSFFTLVLVQAKGWPFQLMCWCFCNLLLLRGSNPFVQHWLYWQPSIDMFNASNPSGDFLTNVTYRSVLIAGVVVGFLTALKKTAVAVWLGQKTCEYYGPQLEKLMKDLILMSAIANLSREIEESANAHVKLSEHYDPAIWQKSVMHYKLSMKPAEEVAALNEDLNEFDEEDDVMRDQEGNDRDVQLSLNELDSRPSIESPSGNGELQSSSKLKLCRLLDSWEEPNNVEDTKGRAEVSIQDILQFRKIMSHLDVTYPFSKAFGLADNRNNCINSAQEVYNRLLKYTPSESLLPFETLSILALDENGERSEEKNKALVHLFPPDGEKKLSLLDFVKSYDEIYRKFRTFRAAVSNSSVLNNAYERIVDVLFYFLLLLLVLTILKYDVVQTVATVMSVVLSFSFAFGPAVSKFTQGVLLVTIQRPYDIGDRIHISQSTAETAADGSSMWFVENISLFYTTLRFASTNEVATISNGDLASTKIINGARSVNASICVKIKFGIYTSYDLIQQFKSGVEDFVKARPREWARLFAIRASNVQADLGFIEYVVALQHRESWQNVGAILASKAELSSFCLELSKELGMRYIQSPLPVHLEIDGSKNIQDVFAVERSEDGNSPESSNVSGGVKVSLGNESDARTSARQVASMFKKPTSGSKK